MADDEVKPAEPTKVVSLEEERQRREEAAKALPKPKAQKSDLYLAVSRAIDGKPGALPAFPRRFHVVEPEPGRRLVLEEAPGGVVRYVDLDAVSVAILRYTVTELATRSAYKWELRQAEAAAKFWRALAEPIDEPPAVRWADEDGLTFSRLPWTFEPDFNGKRMPLFNELFGRISNAPALAEWIGSLFDEGSDRQQYVWLYGRGQNGKGALMRFLARCLGPAFRSKQPPAPNDDKWTAGLLGARLVTFPDCNAYGFPATGLFKSLTGGDLVDINPKFEKPFTAELRAKFLFSSNERPQLSSETADMRRAVYCEVGPIQGDATPGYEARLWEEGGAFLSTCIHNYRTSYPQGGPIRVDTDELAAWVSVVEEDFAALVEEHLVIGTDERCFQAQWVDWCKNHLKDAREKRNFIAYLERAHGLRLHDKARRTVRLKDGRFTKAHLGFRLRAPTEDRTMFVDE